MAIGYQNEFEKWDDVCQAYEMSRREPTEVIFADYNYEDYSGYSTVVYRQGRAKYYIVEASHCSCDGLERQFKPTEYIGKHEFLNAIDKRPGWPWREIAAHVKGK